MRFADWDLLATKLLLRDRPIRPWRSPTRPNISTATLSKAFYYHGSLYHETNQPVSTVEIGRGRCSSGSYAPGRSAATKSPGHLGREPPHVVHRSRRFDEAKAVLQKAIDIARQPGAVCASMFGDLIQCLAACHLHECNHVAWRLSPRAEVATTGEIWRNQFGYKYILLSA